MAEICGEPHPEYPEVVCTQPKVHYDWHLCSERYDLGPWDELPPRPKETRGGRSAGRKALEEMAENIEPEVRVGPPGEEPVNHTDGDRGGETYEREFDYERLNAQARRVYNLLTTGTWWTLSQISGITQDPEASISARLRDFRKPEFGSLDIERRRLDDGLWEYRLNQGATND